MAALVAHNAAGLVFRSTEVRRRVGLHKVFEPVGWLVEQLQGNEEVVQHDPTQSSGSSPEPVACCLLVGP